MRRNKSRKSSHSHKKIDSKNENNKITMQKHQQFEENIDESYRKHKCKKSEFENLNFLDGLILLLLLKEIGLIDNEIDEYKEFEANTKTNENIINQENINYENHETLQENNKSKFDIDYFLDDLDDQE